MSNSWRHDLLTQATCAVWKNGQIKGTAWLVSEEGHLLTAAHVLCEDPEECEIVYDKVEIEFVGDMRREAFKDVYQFSRREGLDFAVLKLRNMPPRRKPLPISPVTSLPKKYKISVAGLRSQPSKRRHTMGRGRVFCRYNIHRKFSLQHSISIQITRSQRQRF